MVNFGGDPYAALIALCAAMVEIVVWGCTAWAFGIPTSASHALIAGLIGAASLSAALRLPVATVRPRQ